VVETFVKNLAALRLVSSFGWDWQNAAEYAASHGARIYAKKQTVWERAYRCALYLMDRFQVAWATFYWPEFVLDPSRFSMHWMPQLARPIPTQDIAASSSADSERELRPNILTHGQLLRLANPADFARSHSPEPHQ
jgi:hypothetical protein